MLVAPGDLVWESCSEISVALKADAFSKKKRVTKAEGKKEGGKSHLRLLSFGVKNAYLFQPTRRC